MSTSRTAGLLFVLALTACGAAADPPAKRVDLFGDPLPDGALLRLGTTRCRAPITGFGILADGTVVTVGPSNEVRTWAPDADVSDLPIPIPVPGPDDRSEYPQVSPDGRLVAVYNLSKLIVYERPVAALTPVAAFEIDRVRRAVFSPDGSELFVSSSVDSRNYTYTVCDVRTGKTRQLEGTKADPEGMAYSGDGKRVGVSVGHQFVVWEAATGKLVANHKTGRLRVYHLALNRAGDVVAAVSGWESRVHFLSVKDGKPAEGLTGPDDSEWVTYAPDGNTILVGGRDRVTWWDPTAGKPIRRFEGATAPGGIFCTPGGFTPDGKTVVAYTERLLLRWDAATGEPRFPAQNAGHQAGILTLGVSPDGKTIATGGLDNRVRTWDAATGKPVHTLASSWTNMRDVPFSPDGKFLYGLGTGQGGPVKWDTVAGKELFRFAFDPAEAEQSRPESLRLSPDGRTLVALSGPVTMGHPSLVTAWDAATGERRSTTRVTYSRLHYGCELSPDGRWLTGAGVLLPVGGGGNDNRLPRTAWEKMIPFLPGTFSPDGRLVTVAGPARSALLNGAWLTDVYEVTTGNRVRELGPGPSSSMAFGPDGRTLVTAGERGLIFWDIPTGKAYGRQTVPDALAKDARYRAIGVVKFFPDGSKVVTGHADTTALVWPVPPRPKAP
jgi:WD40 repeat protein